AAQRRGVGGTPSCRHSLGGRRGAGAAGNERRHGNEPGQRAGSRTVSGIKKTGQKNLMLFSGRAYPELAAEVGQHLGIEPTPTELRDSANGEIYVRFEESVRGCDAFVIESHATPIN